MKDTFIHRSAAVSRFFDSTDIVFNPSRSLELRSVELSLPRTKMMWNFCSPCSDRITWGHGGPGTLRDVVGTSGPCETSGLRWHKGPIKAGNILRKILECTVGAHGERRSGARAPSGVWGQSFWWGSGDKAPEAERLFSF